MYWLILPISLLAVASILHILWYGIIDYFRKRAMSKDYENLIKMIRLDLLEKNEEFNFKTTEFKNLSSIISQLKIDTKDIVTKLEKHLENLTQSELNQLLNIYKEFEKNNKIKKHPSPTSSGS